MKPLLILSMVLALSAGARAQSVSVAPRNMTAADYWVSTNTSSVVVSNTSRADVWLPVSALIWPGCVDGSETNTAAVSYRPANGARSWRVGSLGAQLAGSNAVVALANYPPLAAGDVLTILFYRVGPAGDVTPTGQTNMWLRFNYGSYLRY